MDFAYWWSFSGEGSAAGAAGLFNIGQKGKDKNKGFNKFFIFFFDFYWINLLEEKHHALHYRVIYCKPDGDFFVIEIGFKKRRKKAE